MGKSLDLVPFDVRLFVAGPVLRLPEDESLPHQIFHQLVPPDVAVEGVARKVVVVLNVDEEPPPGVVRKVFGAQEPAPAVHEVNRRGKHLRKAERLRGGAAGAAEGAPCVTATVTTGRRRARPFKRVDAIVRPGRNAARASWICPDCVLSFHEDHEGVHVRNVLCAN